MASAALGAGGYAAEVALAGRRFKLAVTPNWENSSSAGVS